MAGSRDACYYRPWRKPTNRGRTNAMLDFILIVLTLVLFFAFDRYTAGLEHL